MPPRPPPLLAHSTVTPALQAVGRLLLASPHVATVTLPVSSAERALRRIQQRYPSTLADHTTRSALRKLGLPAVQLVVMPPTASQVTALLVTNAVPDHDEDWHLALDPVRPLQWRNYEVTTAALMRAEADSMRRPGAPWPREARRLTWRLERSARLRYRHTITRLVHSTQQGGEGRRHRAPGMRPGTPRTSAGARTQLEELGVHLTRYPGLSGVRTDVWMLGQHMRRLWNQQLKHEALPNWPPHPWCALLPAQLAPLHVVIRGVPHPPEDDERQEEL